MGLLIDQSTTKYREAYIIGLSLNHIDGRIMTLRMMHLIVDIQTYVSLLYHLSECATERQSLHLVMIDEADVCRRSPTLKCGRMAVMEDECCRVMCLP